MEDICPLWTTSEIVNGKESKYARKNTRKSQRI